MPVGNIFNIAQKTTINCSLQSKSIMVVGKSKSGKSTICAQAPKPVFLMTENGGEALTGFTPVPIATWSDFKEVVNQLCRPSGRETFDSVVIDTYTNLILLLDKYIGAKLSTEKNSYDFGSDVEFGKGTKAMKSELGFQLQKLANQGYLLLNVVHAEDKTDFDSGKDYIGTSLSNSVYGVAEKFVDQIIYLRKEKPAKDGTVEHRIWFNSKGGFEGAGGRFCPSVDSVFCSYVDLEKAMLEAISKKGESGATLVTDVRPSVIIQESEYDFDELLTEFKDFTDKVMSENAKAASKIKDIVERELGAGKKVSNMTIAQVGLLAIINSNLKSEFEKGEN